MSIGEAPYLARQSEMSLVQSQALSVCSGPSRCTRYSALTALASGRDTSPARIRRHRILIVVTPHRTNADTA